MILIGVAAIVGMLTCVAQAVVLIIQVSMGTGEDSSPAAGLDQGGKEGEVASKDRHSSPAAGLDQGGKEGKVASKDRQMAEGSSAVGTGTGTGDVQEGGFQVCV